MNLSNCFIGVMAYVSGLLKTVETRQPPYEEVKEEIRTLLAESEGDAVRGQVTRDDYDQARFAVCAWIDEAILNSGWLQKTLWLNDQLQRFHYNVTDAGERFFERLENLGPQEREVREVYYLCLALGFAGRYCQPGDEHHLEQIMATNLKLLLGNTFPLPLSDLFPEARPCGHRDSDKPKHWASSRLVSAACLVAPVLLFGILYLIYHFTLSGISDNFLRTVTN